MIVLQSFLEILILLVPTSSTCEKSPGTCCYNYYREGDTCMECPAGTLGSNCSARCLSGYYGKLCKNLCNCPKLFCDEVNGCPKNHTIFSAAVDWPVISSSTVTPAITFLCSDPTKISISSWRNTLFIGIGSVGTLLILGVVYFMKSWIIQMKTPAIGNPIGPSVSFSVENAELCNNITQLNAHQEREDNNNASSYTGLLVKNSAVQERTLGNITARKGLDPNLRDGYGKKNEEEDIENKSDNVENVYHDAWSVKTLNETIVNISKRPKLSLPHKEQGMDIKLMPNTSVEYHSHYDKGATSEKTLTYNYIGNTSITGGDEDQRRNTNNDLVLDLGGRKLGNKDAVLELMECGDINVRRSIQEHYTDISFPDEPFNLLMNENRESPEREMLATRYLNESTQSVKSTEMYTVPSLRRKSIPKLYSSAINAKSCSSQNDDEFSAGHLTSEEDIMDEENLSFYEDVTIL